MASSWWVKRLNCCQIRDISTSLNLNPYWKSTSSVSSQPRGTTVVQLLLPAKKSLSDLQRWLQRKVDPPLLLSPKIRNKIAVSGWAKYVRTLQRNGIGLDVGRIILSCMAKVVKHLWCRRILWASCQRRLSLDTSPHHWHRPLLAIDECKNVS